jgi:putative transposase
MNVTPSMPRLKGISFPREIIVCAVWAYHRFAMSTANAERLLAKRGVIVSREPIRLWISQFGPHSQIASGAIAFIPTTNGILTKS